MERRFTAGDTVVVTNHRRNRIAAKIGATAQVNCYIQGHGETYVNVTWYRDKLSAGQNDGNYYPEYFELLHQENQAVKEAAEYYHHIVGE